MSGLTTEAEWTKHFRDRSGILNPDNLFDAKGRPTSSNSFSFADGKEYLEELVSLRRDAYGPRGLIEIAKEKLRTVKSDWKYRMNARHSPDVKPKGDALIGINRLTARLKVYREEARAINAEFSKEEKHESEILARKQKKQAGRGLCKLVDGQISRCDFRDVKNGKFTDDGSDVEEYLAECKKVKLENARAAKKAQALELAEIERTEMQKIAEKKKAVETQLKKLRRRKEAA